MHLYDRILPELHIPAAVRWIRALGERIYEDVIKENMQNGFKVLASPKMILNYDHMCKARRDFWKQRFSDFANDEGDVDELTKKQAKAAIEHMEAVVKDWEMKHRGEPEKVRS
ncbi:unnamed protein product [Aureobasidium vineae]|uniref:Uncharacterized protein n=1 Tax=Aureobasidium vineae TaxID=2773715 RepID=A0A9N8PEI8_9PEZI|nr:unnamed protein product [Aureobasidium vineae]